MRHSLSCIALSLSLGFAVQARAGVTYDLVNYPADQNGATLSGYFTVRDHSSELSASAILAWSITISQPGLGSFTTGENDPSAMLSPLGQIVLTPTEMTIAPGAGWLLVQSDNVLLSYARNPNDQYEGQGGNAIFWQTDSPSLGGTEPWVIATTLGSAIPVPEPSSFVLLGTAILGLGMHRAWRGKQLSEREGDCRVSQWPSDASVDQPSIRQTRATPSRTCG